MYYSCILLEGAVDVNGKDLSEFIGIDFECQVYDNHVVILNHITRIPLYVARKYVRIKKTFE